jgi:hypothetical protein
MGVTAPLGYWKGWPVVCLPTPTKEGRRFTSGSPSHYSYPGMIKLEPALVDQKQRLEAIARDVSRLNSAIKV